MLTYHIDAKVSGISVQLIESSFCYCVIYGMEKTVYDLDQWEDALHHTKCCINHGFELR